MDRIRRFILFQGKRDTETMGAEEVRQFPAHLASECGVAASTQNQAFCALLFLYRDVLKTRIALDRQSGAGEASGEIVGCFHQADAGALLGKLRGTARLMANLLCGCGVRLSECVRLRVKDVDFGYLERS